MLAFVGPCFPYGDDRDVLEVSDLADARRAFLEEAVLQQVEEFRSMGVRIV